MPGGFSQRGASILPGARKDSGAVPNPPARFENTVREAFDDGWDSSLSGGAAYPDARYDAEQGCPNPRGFQT